MAVQGDDPNLRKRRYTVRALQIATLDGTVSIAAPIAANGNVCLMFQNATLLFIAVNDTVKAQQDKKPKTKSISALFLVKLSLRS